jgi:hypothetical protein
VCGTRHKKRGKCVANRGRCSSKIHGGATP